MRCPHCGEQNPEGAIYCVKCGRAIGSTMNMVLIYALIGTVLALVTGPIPGSSILLLALDVILVYHIAKRYGIHLAIPDIGCATIGIVVLGTALKAFLTTLFEFIPVVGWWVGKPLVILLGLWTLGYLADRYFRDRRNMQTQRGKV